MKNFRSTLVHFFYFKIADLLISLSIKLHTDHPITTQKLSVQASSLPHRPPETLSVRGRDQPSILSNERPVSLQQNNPLWLPHGRSASGCLKSRALRGGVRKKPSQLLEISTHIYAWEYIRWFGKPRKSVNMTCLQSSIVNKINNKSTMTVENMSDADVFDLTALKQPWRDVPWGRRRENLQKVKDYKPHSEAQHLRVLLHGPAGSGKSSFINSVDSALRGKTTTRALAATAYDGNRPGSHYLLVFSDTMGIERGSGTGAEVNEIKLILEGQFFPFFQFNSGSPPSAQFYNANPTINDKVHVLVCVIPASMLDLMDERKRGCQSIHFCSGLCSFLAGIPQVAILTKIDEACNVVQYNLQYVYRSYWLKKQVMSVTTGIPMHCIFPVRNYSSEIETDDDMDSLILSTMRKIIDYGEDFLNDQSDPKALSQASQET
uniref:G domain-containing protein n=1 Tax=Salarias fasciatus TaxID=181472 RepID=A0A672G510_SALFA